MRAIRLLSREASGEQPTTAQVRLPSSTERITSSTGQTVATGCPLARVALHHLLQRHAVPADGDRRGAAAGAARPRGRLPGGADVLRPDAPQLGLSRRGRAAAAPLRARVRRGGGGGVPV